MEAKGHENLIKMCFPQLREFEAFHKKKLSFPISTGALYLGNWIADYSQLIDETPIALISDVLKSPDKILDLLKKIKNFIDVRIIESLSKIKTYNDLFELTPKESQISTKAAFPTLMLALLPLKVDAEVIKAIKEPFQFLSRELGKSISSTEEFLKNYKEKLGNLAEQEIDPETVDKMAEILRKKGRNITLEDIRNFVSKTNFNEACYVYSGNILYTLVKILGYNKFCAVNKNDGLFVEFGTYDYIFENLFERYYPHEHLDRPFDLEKVKNIKGNAEKIKEATSYLIYNYLDIRGGKKNSYGNGQRHYLYDYLFEFLQIGTGSLWKSEQYFRKFIFQKLRRRMRRFIWN